MYRNIDTSGILGRWSVLVIDVVAPNVLHQDPLMRLHVAGSDKLFVTLMLDGVVGADVSSSKCDVYRSWRSD